MVERKCLIISELQIVLPKPVMVKHSVKGWQSDSYATPTGENARWGLQG
jgi:hypothetical protein